jgi:glycosyltransferase involved in cell wall biosynthesis
MEQKRILIGFDAKRIVANASGLGSYGRNLINDLAQAGGPYRYRLYAPDSGRDDLRNQVKSADCIDFRYSDSHCRLGKDLWRRHGIVKDLQRDGVSIFHGLSGELPRGLHKAGVRSLLTIHDLIFLRHPEYYKPVDVWLYKRKFYQSLREADRVVAISECTKRDILYYSDYPEDHIDVIYQSCSPRFHDVPAEDQLQDVVRRYALPSRFVLNVGTIEKRKNVALAARALAEVPDDVHLVIVGRSTPYVKEVAQAAQEARVTERIHLLHGVPNDDLSAIYRLATCFVYPSRYEGFGIPIIEAIQSGLPVVAATSSCLEEAGGPDSLYVHPDDIRGMANALRQLLSEDTAERVGRARQYVRKFENNNVARQIISEYQLLMHNA